MIIYSHGIYDDPTVCYSNNEADHGNFIYLIEV